MNCPKCGKEAPDGALFCTGCGCRLDNLAPNTPETNADDETKLEQGASETAEPAETVPAAGDTEQAEEVIGVEVPYDVEPDAQSPVPAYEAPETAEVPANDAVAVPEHNKQESGFESNPYFSVEPTGAKKKKTPNFPVKPLSAWSYIWREFIFLIPVVNIVVLFVFAFADGINKNSRSFARSKLVYALIITLLLIASVILLYVYRSAIFAWLADALEWLRNLAE